MNEVSEMEVFVTEKERAIRERRMELLKTCPIPKADTLNNLGLFLNAKNLSRILFFDYIYQKIIDTQGVIVEFGTRWGQNVSLFSALRAIYEPFNRHRVVLGFDTFQGLSALSEHDKSNRVFFEGGLSVTPDYENYLEEIMKLQEDDSPMPHIKKFSIIKGDASVTFKDYLDQHPETIVALAFFDMDIYKPTKDCLTLLKDRLCKGAIVGFDELNDPMAPGETVALREVFDLNSLRLKRYRHASRVSYFVYE